MLVAWDPLGEGHYLFLGSGVSLLLQMLEEEVVWGTLLLTVLGGGSAAGTTSPACPASRPAEIMEQRLSNGHPGLLAPRSCGALSVCRLPGDGLQRLEGWLGKGMWIGAGGWSLSLLLGQQWKPKDILRIQWFPAGWCSKEGFLLRWDSAGSWWCL